jgi:uncharacterized protein YjaG (DUF416 family)
MQITSALLEAGANIEDLSRISSETLEILIKVSGISTDTVKQVIETFSDSADFSLSIGA